MSSHKKLRVIISGGGTGGHIFPAISIADTLRVLNPDTEILFVGAEGKMEMEKVPAAGYEIVGLPISGLQRKINLKNVLNAISVPFKLINNIRRARKIIKDFKPDIAVGVGGYASAPLLFAATRMKIPTLIQEQNGFAGLTNKLLGAKVDRICVAYDGMERFFPKEKIVFSGNPIRVEMRKFSEEKRLEACSFYGLNPDKKHLLIIGGSLGAGTLNKAMKVWIEAGLPGGEDVEILWQCGRYYKKDVDNFMQGRNLTNVHASDFIAKMDLAYAAADLIISRSGASSVSEICATGKAAIFVPSPNVAEDHQTHNAMALANRGAAEIVKDADAQECLLSKAMTLIHNSNRISELEQNTLSLAKLDAANCICEEIYKLVSE